MTKSDFIKIVATKTGQTQATTQSVLESFFKTIHESKEKIQFVGFGSFEVIEKPEHQGRNPANGETITIKAKKVLKFKPAKL